MPGFLGQNRGIERGDRLDGVATGNAAVGMVGDDVLLPVEGRRHMGEHPVVFAPLRNVFHISEDFLARGDGVPEQLEHRARHVGMAQDAVRLTQQLGFAVAGDVAERLVGVGDPTLQVGLGDDDVAFRKEEFPIDGSAQSHCNGNLPWRREPAKAYARGRD